MASLFEWLEHQSVKLEVAVSMSAYGNMFNQSEGVACSLEK